MLYGIMDIASDVAGIKRQSNSLRLDEFWAVDDVSFTLKSGEVLGIIGANGAGKSTLLKMISGILPPDNGRIEVHGRLSALIEIGAGFHPLLTGRENIYVSGAMLGMKRAEVNRKFEAIVEFSGLQQFLDMPVKFYSSGMYVRLGFAVAAHLDPDILIVDEILAVGDAIFRRKCIEYLNQLNKNGAPFILVSHNMQTIGALATHCLLLKYGKVTAAGPPSEVIAEYDLEMRPRAAVEVVSENTENELRLVRSYQGYSLDDMVIERVWVEDATDQRRLQFLSGEEIVVCVQYHTQPSKTLDGVIAQVAFMNEFDIRCLGSEVRFLSGSDLGVLNPTGIIRICFPSVKLSTSRYSVSVVFHDRSHTVPYAVGIWGYIELRAPLPSWSPELNMPLCWADADWVVEKS
jgi:lipopolysaccharide transport system ATP-binding protein